MTVRTLGDRKLLVCRSCHPIFVNTTNHNPRTVLLRKFQHLKKTLIAIFIVRRVKDAFPPCNLKPSLHLGPFSGIQHQRQRGVCHQPGHQFLHVTLTIAPDIIHIHIQNVRAFFNLRLCDRHQSIPIIFRQQIPNLLRATRIQPFPNDQERVFLLVWLR